MEVKRLSLRQFRNYEHCELEFCPGVNVIAGENGQGKTTLLEAIFLCTCARSHRTSKDRELIRHEASEYRVELEFFADRGDEAFAESLSLAYLDALPGVPERGRSQRCVFYNGVKLDRIAELMGLFNAVIFCPEDILLIKEGPAGRRRFLDMLLSQLSRPYFCALQRYHNVLAQRNKLLKQLKEAALAGAEGEAALSAELSVWNGQLCEQAVVIIEQRAKVCAELAELAAERHRAISGGREELCIRYEGLRSVDAASTREAIREQYLNRLLAHEREDVFKGSTSVGPHRDDVELLLGDKALRAFGSQGQQRTAVLALKLAELELLRRARGRMPVLLLDDVLPELDERRRLSLIEGLKGAQVFITCTDVEEVHEKLKRLLEDKGSRTFRLSDNRLQMV